MRKARESISGSGMRRAEGTAAGAGLAASFGMKVTRIGVLHPMCAFRSLCAARHVLRTCDDR
ncbi:hypothetical protein GCM10023108_22610 [Saccharopolyspora hordei]